MSQGTVRRPPAARWQVGPIEADGEQAASRWQVAAPTGRTGAEAVADLATESTLDLAPRVLRRADRPHPFTWVGAHGGAGSTSLSVGSGTGADLTQLWPDPRLGWPSAAVVVLRGNAAGLEAATLLVRQVTSRAVPDVELAALVVVADSPSPVPRVVQHRLRDLGRLVPLVVEVPWIEEWREAPYTPHPLAAEAAERIDQAVRAGRSSV